MLKFSGKIFDVTRVIEGTVIVEGNKIFEVEEGKMESDSTKGFIIPGMIDAHLHFFGVHEDNVMSWNLVNEIDVAIRSTRDMERLLRSGFTTVRDLGSKVATRLSNLERSGEIIGPRVIASGYSLAITGGDDDPRDLPLEMAQKLSYSFYCDSPYECRKAVRLAVRQGAGVIKVYASGAFSQGGKILPGLGPDELKSIVEESHRFGLKVASHAYGREAILNSVEAGVDTIEHGLGLDKDTASMMLDRGTCYIPTLATYEIPFHVANPEVRRYREEAVTRHMKEDVKLAKSVGLKIATGTDYVGSDARPHGKNYREAVLLSQFMGNDEVLASTTSVAAECLGIWAGRIEKGYLADLVVLRNDPLQNVENLSPDNVLYIVKDGKMYRGAGRED